MAQNMDNYKRGTAEFLILYLLCDEDLYGYRITQLFNEKSGGRYTMLEGSLYLILFRLEDLGCVTGYTEVVNKKRKRKYYHITEKGRAYLEKALLEYDEICRGVALILDKESEVK